MFNRGNLTRFTDSQILDAVKRVEAGFAVPDICRELGVSTATFYKWRSKYGGMDVSLMSRMTELEEEKPMSSLLFFDDRWIGKHGIGRVALNLNKFLVLNSLKLSGSPTSPLDPIRLSIHMLFLPKKAIIFSPGYNSPLFFFRRFIFIVHDLNHIDCPDNSNFFKKIYYNTILKNACRKAEIVLTVSSFSKNRIVDWAGISGNKIINIGNGVDPIFTSLGPKYKPGFMYFLCVSNRKPHKNEKNILEAFAVASIDKSVRLLFTGVPDKCISELIKKLKLDDKVQFLGKISDELLANLYRGAEALLFPSLYEGFGLPVIEAMACGTPVITSNSTSLIEIADSSAILVDPSSRDQIARSIETIMVNKDLTKKLIANGIERAKLFNWSFVCSRIEEVLNFLEKGTADD